MKIRKIISGHAVMNRGSSRPQNQCGNRASDSPKTSTLRHRGTRHFTAGGHGPERPLSPIAANFRDGIDRRRVNIFTNKEISDMIECCDPPRGKGQSLAWLFTGHEAAQPRSVSAGPRRVSSRSSRRRVPLADPATRRRHRPAIPAPIYRGFADSFGPRRIRSRRTEQFDADGWFVADTLCGVRGVGRNDVRVAGSGDVLFPVDPRGFRR